MDQITEVTYTMYSALFLTGRVAPNPKLGDADSLGYRGPVHAAFKLHNNQESTREWSFYAQEPRPYMRIRDYQVSVCAEGSQCID
jgi:hypothetical protein